MKYVLYYLLKGKDIYCEIYSQMAQKNGDSGI